MSIDKSTPDPDDGTIDRDPVTGEAIGSLQEGAIRLAYDAMPERTVEERIEGIRYARDMLHSLGITSMQTGYNDKLDLQAFKALDDKGELGLRTLVSFFWNPDIEGDQLPDMLKYRDLYSSANIRPTAVKIFQDGVMENYTAGMLDPYLTDEGGHGMQVFEPGALNTLVTRLAAANFQVHFHAIGDRATRECLDAVEAAQQAHGHSELRHTIVHLQFVHPADYDRFTELGVVANFQPYWALADEYVTELTTPFIKEDVNERMYPIRSIVDTGARVSFGSDWGVSSADPLLGIETAITRLDPEGLDYPPLNIDQAVTLQQAIRAYTIEAAYQLHHEDKTGSIEIGKLADLVVLDTNLFEIEPEGINEARAVLTLFGGEPVFGDPDRL